MNSEVVVTTRLLYSLKEAAFQLSISKRGLAYILSQGLIPVRKLGGRTMIPADAPVRSPTATRTSTSFPNPRGRDGSHALKPQGKGCPEVAVESYGAEQDSFEEAGRK